MRHGAATEAVPGQTITVKHIKAEAVLPLVDATGTYWVVTLGEGRGEWSVPAPFKLLLMTFPPMGVEPFTFTFPRKDPSHA